MFKVVDSIWLHAVKVSMILLNLFTCNCQYIGTLIYCENCTCIAKCLNVTAFIPVTIGMLCFKTIIVGTYVVMPFKINNG